MMKKFISLVFILFLFCSCITKKQSTKFYCQNKINSFQVDSSQFIVENKYYKVVFRTRERVVDKFGPLDFCIRDWILKSKQQDQVDVCIDGSALRPFLKNIVMIRDTENIKEVQFEYGDSLNFVQQYTFYSNSRFIEIDYLKYPTDWFNTVDIGTPGGITERFTAATSVYGQEEWIRDFVYHDDIYWGIDNHNGHAPDNERLALEKHSILYKNHLIMLVSDPKTGIGYGRIMPVWNKNNGGVRILKLLWDQGFENFPVTGNQTVNENKPFKGTIFLFENSTKNAFKNAKIWIDKNELKQS